MTFIGAAVSKGVPGLMIAVLVAVVIKMMF